MLGNTEVGLCCPRCGRVGVTLYTCPKCAGEPNAAKATNGNAVTKG